MSTRALLVLLFLIPAVPASARGLLVPEDVKLPPLAMVDHKVTVTIDDQVSVTTVEQTFRNHTDRDLEATYLFPVPRGASVNKFAMWVNGTETAGELLDAKKANKIYTDIVRKTQDPGLLEYMGNDLMKLRVFPVPANGDQKVRISFTAVAQKDAGVVEYVYPLKADGPATRTLEEFSVNLTVKSQLPIQSVYSPTHAIDVTRQGEHQVAVTFEKDQAVLDKDFQLFYGVGEDTIGLTPLYSREVSADDGYFQLLLTPRVEVATAKRIPRDVILVLDTSGSMSDVKMSQAKKALKHCLDGLKDGDRFGIIAFATSVRTYQDELVEGKKDQLERARKWISDLRAGGGTAILPALQAATAMAGKTPSRSTSIVFFTDGLPTVDETNPDKIVAAMARDNPAGLRVFTFGVGDNVNAAMLDQLSEATRAVSTYVRPAEDITTKVAALTAKISHPVLTDVRLTASNVKLHEVYPTQLPDLFHGNQLVVLGRYAGDGDSVIVLTGRVGDETRELVYEVSFPPRTTDEKGFVEDLWATAESRLPARPDSGQRRVRGDRRRGRRHGHAVRDRHAVHQPPRGPRRPGCRSAGGRLHYSTGGRAADLRCRRRSRWVRPDPAGAGHDRTRQAGPARGQARAGRGVRPPTGERLEERRHRPESG